MLRQSPIGSSSSSLWSDSSTDASGSLFLPVSSSSSSSPLPWSSSSSSSLKSESRMRKLVRFRKTRLDDSSVVGGGGGGERETEINQDCRWEKSRLLLVWCKNSEARQAATCRARCFEKTAQYQETLNDNYYEFNFFWWSTSHDRIRREAQASGSDLKLNV